MYSPFGELTQLCFKNATALPLTYLDIRWLGGILKAVTFCLFVYLSAVTTCKHWSNISWKTDATLYLSITPSEFFASNGSKLHVRDQIYSIFPYWHHTTRIHSASWHTCLSQTYKMSFSSLRISQNLHSKLHDCLVWVPYTTKTVRVTEHTAVTCLLFVT
jgi:hypothetical protein